MATDALAGLFGSPLSQEQLQNQLIEERAAKMADMNLGQMGAFLGYKGGAQLGQGVAGLFGQDVTDPTVRKAAQLRQLAQGIDVSTTDGLVEYAKRLQENGFQQEAARLGQQILANRKTEAETTKALRERAGADPVQQILRTGKFSPQSVAKYDKSKNIEDLELLDKQNYAITETAEGVFVVNKNDPKEKTRIGSPVQRGTQVSVGLSTVDKESNLRKDFTAETKHLTTAINTADRIEKLLNMGSLGEIIAQKQFAKLAGDNNISNRDVEALSNFGDLGQRLAGTLTRFFEGTYSESQKQEALDLVKQLQTQGLAQYGQVQKQYRDRAAAEGIPEKTATFIAPDLPRSYTVQAQVFPEGTKVRDKRTGDIFVVRNGKLVPAPKGQ